MDGSKLGLRVVGLSEKEAGSSEMMFGSNVNLPTPSSEGVPMNDSSEGRGGSSYPLKPRLYLWWKTMAKWITSAVRYGGYTIDLGRDE
jgi:hypothetical protein